MHRPAAASELAGLAIRGRSHPLRTLWLDGTGTPVPWTLHLLRPAVALVCVLHTNSAPPGQHSTAGALAPRKPARFRGLGWAGGATCSSSLPRTQGHLSECSATNLARPERSVPGLVLSRSCAPESCEDASSGAVRASAALSRGATRSGPFSAPRRCEVERGGQSRWVAGSRFPVCGSRSRSIAGVLTYWSRVC